MRGSGAPQHRRSSSTTSAAALSLLPVGVDVRSAVHQPRRQVGCCSRDRGPSQTNLYIYPLDELSADAAHGRAPAHLHAGRKREAQFSPDSKEVYYLDHGRINVPVDVDNARTRARSAVAAELDVDFAHEKIAVFDEAWSYLRDNFFDDRRSTASTGPRSTTSTRRYIAGAAHPRRELRRLMNLMIGELNASHSGMGWAGHRTAARHAAGSACASTAPSTSSDGPAAPHRRSLPLGPAALAGIKPGDVLARRGRHADRRAHQPRRAASHYKTGKRITLRHLASPKAQARARSRCAP